MPRVCPACGFIKAPGCDGCPNCFHGSTKIEERIAQFKAWRPLSPAFLTSYRELTGRDAGAIVNTIYRHEREVADAFMAGLERKERLAHRLAA